MSERRTPFYDFHRRSARNVVKGGGDFMFPTSYASSLEEHLNVRKNVGVQDLSTMGEVDIKGPGAERLVRRLLVNEVQDMEPGQLRYSTICNERGAYVTDVTAAVALPVVQGPRSRRFLKTVVEGVDLDALRFFRFAKCRIGEIELIISRSGYTGELGYELYTPADQTGVLWESLLERGREFDLRPYGVEAMQSLRIEKSLPLYGPDISEDDTPFHVGLARWIRLEKRDLIGREALLRIQERGLDRRWVGLTLESEAPAAAGAKVYSVGDVATFREVIETGAEAGEYEDAVMPGERQIGRVTSSAMGHSVGKMLAMAYVETAHSWPANNLIVEINGRPVPAKVAQTPFFDPENARIRSEPTENARIRSEPTPRPVATISSGSNVPARKYTN